MIYTSYYRLNYKNKNAIGISASVPQYYYGERMKILAPTWELIEALRGEQINNEEYANLYIELLDSRKLTPLIVYQMLPFDAILLCWETERQFCHRRVLAKWIEDGLPFDVEIKEWESIDEQKKDSFVDENLEF